MFRRFSRDRSGIAAVEFALVAPIFAVILVMGWSVWQGEVGAEQAKTALRAGAQYYTAGGSTDSAAQTIAQNAWTSAPSNASVTTSRACYCAGAAANCSGTCSTGQQRTVYVTLTATGNGQGMLANQLQTQTETIRVE